VRPKPVLCETKRSAASMIATMLKTSINATITQNPDPVFDMAVIPILAPQV
jgi:hypothetical protein